LKVEDESCNLRKINETFLLQFLQKLLGIDELLPQSKVMKYLAEYLCGHGGVEKDICSNIIFVLAGYDKPQLNQVHIYIDEYTCLDMTRKKHIIETYLAMYKQTK